jgi:hypothetical protein
MITTILLSLLIGFATDPSDSSNSDQWLIEEWETTYQVADHNEFPHDDFIYLVSLDGDIMHTISKDNILSGVVSKELMNNYTRADFMFSTECDEFYLMPERPMIVQHSSTYPYNSAD